MANARSLAVAIALTCAASASRAQDSLRTPPADSSRRLFVDRIVAVVGTKAITYTQLVQAIEQEAADRQRRRAPPLSSDTVAVKQFMLDAMIETELLIQQAEAFKLVVPVDKLNTAVDAEIARVRDRFKTPAELREALANSGLRSLDEYRREITERIRRSELPAMVMDTLQKLGRRPVVTVPEEDIKAAYDSLSRTTENKGPLVSFRQIVMRITPTPAAEARSKAIADSLLGLMHLGADFDSLARKVSADSASAVLGGDVGWFRRGKMTKAFEDMAFSLPVDRLSPPVKTEYGYHIIRVDRVRAGEVKARHILIPPVVDSTDIALARAKGDSIAAALRAGANFDSLVNAHHDKGREDFLLEGFPISDFPEFYAKAAASLKPNEVSAAFEIPTAQGPPKIGIVQMMKRNESGVPTLEELRGRIRRDLQVQLSIRRLLDALKKEIYVEIRLDDAPAKARARGSQ